MDLSNARAFTKHLSSATDSIQVVATALEQKLTRVELEEGLVNQLADCQNIFREIF